MSTQILPLFMNDRNLYLKPDKIKEKAEDLELFLMDESKMNSKDFAKKVLLANEVQSNNGVEGYYDDIGKIKEIVKDKRKYKNTTEEDKRRILNLYAGYKYIMGNHDINKDNISQLYSTLSNGLLEQEDIKEMGEYYRKNLVYIYYSSDLTKEPDVGVDAELIDYKMNELISFINNYKVEGHETDEFIKSQIIHFYFVYVHPFYDINGRTARTLSMWQLINKETYPFVIFNRGIQLNKQEYYKVIREVKKFNNITYFINYMLNTVLTELEKEHVMQCIASSSSDKLNAVDYQTLQYLLSMNGLITVGDFISMYNRHNDKKSPKFLHEQMIEPLIDKKVIIPGRTTNKSLYSNQDNYLLDINRKFIDDKKISNINILKKKND